MSYCRWSSDDWSSDIYCYEAVWGRWVTHIAGNRTVLREPLPPEVPYPQNRPEVESGPEWGAWTAQLHTWYARYKRVTDMQSEGERVGIDLPYAGQTVSDASPGECADRLESLRDLGYTVPQYAIDQLRAEEAAGYTGYVEEDEI